MQTGAQIKLHYNSTRSHWGSSITQCNKFLDTTFIMKPHSGSLVFDSGPVDTAGGRLWGGGGKGLRWLDLRADKLA